jgi:hypothetical protein
MFTHIKYHIKKPGSFQNPVKLIVNLTYIFTSLIISYSPFDFVIFK